MRYRTIGSIRPEATSPTDEEVEAAAAALWETIHNLPPGSYAVTREKEKARYRLRARAALTAARSAHGEAR